MQLELCLYDQYNQALAHMNPCPGGHKIYIFGRSFLANYCYIVNLSAKLPRRRKMKYINLTVFIPKLKPFKAEGYEVYNFPTSSNIDVTYQIW